MESEAHTTLLLFVYGSLIDPIHRAEVLGRFAGGVPAILHGYARARSLHWYIYRCAGAQTEGLVLTDLDAQDFATLDRYEDVPALYIREQIEAVDMGGARIRYWVYLPTAWAAPSAE
jgi:cation transport regulator ChaC